MSSVTLPSLTVGMSAPGRGQPIGLVSAYTFNPLQALIESIENIWFLIASLEDFPPEDGDFLRSRDADLHMVPLDPEDLDVDISVDDDDFFNLAGEYEHKESFPLL